MSGGFFDYQQYRIDGIASEIDRLINNNFIKDEENPNDPWGYEFPPDIIKRFDEARKTLRLAAVMAERIDYFVCGDDGIESFRERWEEEVEPLKKGLDNR